MTRQTIKIENIKQGMILDTRQGPRRVVRVDNDGDPDRAITICSLPMGRAGSRVTETWFAGALMGVLVG